MSKDAFDNLYAAPVEKESLLRRYGARIVGGIACSAFVAFVMHLPVIKTLILWACQLVLIVFGRPSGAERLDKLDDKLAHLVEKGKQVAKAHPGESILQKAIAPVVAPVKEVVAVKQTVENVKEKAEQGVKTIKETGEKVAEAVSGAGDRAKQAVGGTVASVAVWNEARAKEKEKKQRETLEAHAAVIGLKIDPAWTFPRLQAEVLNAELKWKALHGPNAKCPNPRCRYTFRIKSKRAEDRRCPLCGLVFSTRAALAAGAAQQKSIHIFGR